MTVPSKVHVIQLVKIQPEERLATTSEQNLASRNEEEKAWMNAVLAIRS
ncbi:MAG: hypothetical protein QMD22_07705 [archaeon]|nr:hypothetical protein [archaeon]